MAPLDELLRTSRHELLDLSTRNRLLSIPVASKSARIVQVHDERSAEVFRLLVAEKKLLSFLPGRASSKAAGLSTAKGPVGSPRSATIPTDAAPAADPEADEVDLPQPDEESGSTDGLAARHADLRLQTSLTSEGLQRRLLDLYRDAQAMIEEQGVNVLFLALGQLEWFEADDEATPRRAPLILVPVRLGRRSASERFVLQWTEEEIEENLSLQAKLQTDFGIRLPDFPDTDELDLAGHYSAIAEAVRGRPGWQVLPNAITLGFFSFAKFLMYRDLTPENWPEANALTAHPLIRGLLQDGFPLAENLAPRKTRFWTRSFRSLLWITWWTPTARNRWPSSRCARGKVWSSRARLAPARASRSPTSSPPQCSRGRRCCSWRRSWPHLKW